MAAPHVSGTAALIASVFPSLAADPAALKARLLATGKPDPATNGLTVTGTVVDAFRSLDTVGPLAVAPSSFAFDVGVDDGPHHDRDPCRLADRHRRPQRRGCVWAASSGPVPDRGSRPSRSTTARSATRTLTFGTTYGFRDRARDGAGNWGAFVAGPPITALRYQDTSSKVTFSASWRRYTTSSASGGHTRYATRRGATATFRFTGRAVALIAPKGPTRGSAKLYVDGVYVSTISLYRSRFAPRIVVAARSWSSSGAHTLKLVLVGTARHPRFDVDAFAILK